ncbi:MAG: helix-turn-helix transcriptional regulator [Pseudonocardiales bacterium]|nr:helix-turn-helix transcriptional regulator [Pseudonocardiales bacterium]
MVRAGDNGEVPNPWQAQLRALGAFIRAQRQLADLSLREMAALTRISNAYLSQIERGLHQPSLTVLRAIAEGLGLTTEQLLAQAGWAQASDAGPADASADVPAEAPAASTEDSIRCDPRLTETQREALLGVYRSFIEGETR